ncbi:hypothetical protein GALMADRAFT_228570 [Galerina marginata CBS 339.88]|uniref:Uncharacterized protein n=1 Tax=Galerina marginata (strain CBS 339.88) TaxID=685588 RepID=A0A067T1I2_GALM3|nr:hypothetical protein GALMADRAFT_228570 [Galerina marginata CBS 339.88]
MNSLNHSITVKLSIRPKRRGFRRYMGYYDLMHILVDFNNVAILVCSSYAIS